MPLRPINARKTYPISLLAEQAAQSNRGVDLRRAPGVEVDSAGLNHDAEVRLSAEQIEWADTIVVMETCHRNRLTRHYGDYLAGKRIAVLGIPDDYEFMQPELIELLRIRCRRYLP